MSERLATPLESVLGSDADREWVRARAADRAIVEGVDSNGKRVLFEHVKQSM